MRKSYRIFGLFTTKSPLSHISESISTCSYLVQEPILQENGEIEEVFCYNGNALRGQLRDLAASYLLDKLQMTTSIDGFHLLFSGGKISGDQAIDINQAKAMRQAIPMFSIFGGGVGNQIIAGKLKVGSSYPLCLEAINAIAERWHFEALKTSYKDMTIEKSFTRFDDAKNLDKQEYVNPLDLPMLEGGKKKKDGDVSTQMRMTSELLIAGVKLAHEIDLVQVTEVELGAFISALHRFAQSPYIGGQSNRGHGRVDYRAVIIDSDGNQQDLIKITGEAPKLSKFAEQAKAAYDEHLVEQYNQFIASKNSEIRGLLGAN